MLLVAGPLCDSRSFHFECEMLGVEIPGLKTGVVVSEIEIDNLKEGHLQAGDLQVLFAILIANGVGLMMLTSGT